MSGNSAALSSILKKLDRLKLKLFNTSSELTVETLSTDKQISLRKQYVSIIDEWLVINNVCSVLMKLNKEKALMQIDYLNNLTD